MKNKTTDLFAERDRFLQKVTS